MQAKVLFAPTETALADSSANSGVGSVVTVEAWDYRTGSAVDLTTSGFTLSHYGYGMYLLDCPDVYRDSVFMVKSNTDDSVYCRGQFDGSRWLLVGQNYRIWSVGAMTEIDVTHWSPDDSPWPVDDNSDPIVAYIGYEPVQQLDNGTFQLSGSAGNYPLGTYNGTTFTYDSDLTNMIISESVSNPTVVPYVGGDGYTTTITRPSGTWTPDALNGRYARLGINAPFLIADNDATNIYTNADVTAQSGTLEILAGTSIPPNSLVYVYLEASGVTRYDTRGRDIQIRIEQGMVDTTQNANLYALLEKVRWNGEHVVRADAQLEEMYGGSLHMLALSGSLTVTPEQMAISGIATESSRGAIEAAVLAGGGGSSLTSADVWSYATRTLTGAGASGLATEASVLGQFSVTQGIVQAPAVSDNSTLTVYEESCTPLTFTLGTAWNLTGKEVWFAYKNQPSDAAALVSVEATVTDAVNGVATYTPTVATFPNAGKFYYEVYVCNDDATHTAPQTVFLGSLIVKKTVRPTS